MPHICKVALAASAETYRWDKGLHTATNTSVHNCGMYRKAAKKSVLCAARVRQECIRSCSLTSREKKGGGGRSPISAKLLFVRAFFYLRLLQKLAELHALISDSGHLPLEIPEYSAFGTFRRGSQASSLVEKGVLFLDTDSYKTPPFQQFPS